MLAFYDWSALDDDAQFNRESPNLRALRSYLTARGFVSLGIYGERDVRAGARPSAHSHGAALDASYADNLTRGEALAVATWIIANHERLGVQAVHDYVGCRIWRCNRTHIAGGWRTQSPSSATGMGQSWAQWFHFETARISWAYSTPIETRLAHTTEDDDMDGIELVRCPNRPDGATYLVLGKPGKPIAKTHIGHGDAVPLVAARWNLPVVPRGIDSHAEMVSLGPVLGQVPPGWDAWGYRAA